MFNLFKAQKGQFFDENMYVQIENLFWTYRYVEGQGINFSEGKNLQTNPESFFKELSKYFCRNLLGFEVKKVS